MTSELQQLCGRWHTQCFPLANPVEICLKAAEEMGETASEVLIDFSNNTCKTNPGVSKGPDEAADTVISLMALVERFYPGRDLLVEVQKKMNILTDPNSGHRAAVELV